MEENYFQLYGQQLELLIANLTTLLSAPFLALNGLTWYTLASGNNVFFPKVNIMDFVSSTMLPDSGIMPIKFLAIPALVGAAVVGSFERRISGWIRKKNN